MGGVCFLVLCGMENTIFLSEVLEKMKKLDERKNPVPFTLSVRSFNMQNKIGGKIIRYIDKPKYRAVMYEIFAEDFVF